MFWSQPNPWANSIGVAPVGPEVTTLLRSTTPTSGSVLNGPRSRLRVLAARDHTLHRSGVPVSFLGGAGPPAFALALRRPARLAHADDRADARAGRGGEARSRRAHSAAHPRDADRPGAVRATRVVGAGVPRFC